VPRNRASALVYVPIKNGAKADPIRGDQCKPRIVKPGREQVACLYRISDEGGEETALFLLAHSFVTESKLLGDFLRRC